LVVEAIASLQSGGVSPDIWKIEGLEDSKDCTRIVDQARADGRDGVACIVLGRGAEMAKVKQWITTSATVRGFSGFAVGRTLWHDALSEHGAGRSSELETAWTIASRYRTLIEAHEAADTN
jgi:myo-inositol catabolism protein IolC